MGRPSEGFKLRTRGKWRTVRFSLPGRGQVERSTGVRVDEPKDRAAARAAEIYALEIRCPRPKRERVKHTDSEVASDPERFLETVGQWLETQVGLIDDRTIETHALYARAHWAPHFGSVAGITSTSIAEYQQNRLTKVSASSVGKESGALRKFLAWLGSDLVVPFLPGRSTGKRVETAWKGSQEVSPEETEAILEVMVSPARERYTFGYETSLRGETIDTLALGVHWHEGSVELTITDENDKARFGRSVPLSARALVVLTAQAKTAHKRGGFLFGTNRSRKLVKRAGVKVLGPERGRRLVPTDLRAARLTHLLEKNATLPGVQFLAGHKNVTTTAKYIKASARAAREAIDRGEA
jgi:integrase